MTVGNTDEQRQLVSMSSISTQRTLNEENILMISEIENQNENPLTTEIIQQRLVSRLVFQLQKTYQSIHPPHLSDGLLRTIFLLFITLIGFTSFTIALIVGSSTLRFKQQCPLYASFTYQIQQTSHSNWTVKIIPLTEKFSSQATCDFCTFYNVFTFIYCVMTGFFFILFNSDERIVTTNDQCLIIPWFPISIILGFFSLINAAMLTNGFLKFCITIISNDNRVKSCTQLNDLYFEQYPTVSSFFSYMLIAIIASWIELIIFIGIITVLTIRLSSSIDWNVHHEQRIDDKSTEQIENS